MLDSPFGFYCAYLDLVRPMEIRTEEMKLKGQIADLEEENEILRALSDEANSFSKDFFGK